MAQNKVQIFSAGACTWQKILLRLQVWKLSAAGRQFMRAADCGKLAEKAEGLFRQAQIAAASAAAIPAGLLLAEGLAVGALIHGGVGLVGTNQDAIQRAVVLGIAMVGASLDGALNTFVGIAFHHDFLLFIWCKVSMGSFHFSIHAVAFWEKICYCEEKINCCLAV